MSPGYRVVNWKKHQHYGDTRKPIWIKLHCAILNDMAFMQLPPAHQSLLMLLWVLAAENGGDITSDLTEVAFRLRRQSVTATDMQVLVAAGFLECASGVLATRYQDASSVLADCYQVASTEVEVEVEVEVEKPQTAVAPLVRPVGQPVKPVKKFIPPTAAEVQAYCDSRNNGINGQEFVDHYSVGGWVYGKTRTPIKDWHAAVRTWEQTRKKEAAQAGGRTTGSLFDSSGVHKGTDLGGRRRLMGDHQ